MGVVVPNDVNSTVACLCLQCWVAFNLGAASPTSAAVCDLPCDPTNPSSETCGSGLILGGPTRCWGPKMCRDQVLVCCRGAVGRQCHGALDAQHPCPYAGWWDVHAVAMRGVGVSMRGGP